MTKHDDELFDDDAGRLPEGAGVFLCLGMGLAFWLGFIVHWLVFS